MVPKSQKARSTSSKTTTTKKSATKVKKVEKLTNGHVSENENIDLKPVTETNNMEDPESALDMPENIITDNTENHIVEPAESTSGRTTKRNIKSRTGPRAVLKDVKQEKKVDSNPKIALDVQMEREADPAQSEMKVELESVKPDSKATKRKPAEVKTINGKKEAAVPNIKAKRQKVLLEVPSINTVSGKVFVIGSNDVGQLGFDTEKEQSKRPSPLDLPYSIVDVTAGGMHSVCLTESGEVLTFGCNDEGALGRVTSEEGSEYIPKKVDIPEQIVQISAGDSHTAALSSSGQVYIWGNFRSSDGGMGLVREGVKESAPVRILRGIKIVKIASGTDHLVCLSEEGIVYTCGRAESGQLGRISERSNVDGGRQGIMVLLTPDKVPVTNKSLPVDNIWTGESTTFLKIKDKNIVHGCGLNNYNQLGIETPKKNYISKPIDLKSFNERTWSQIDGGQHHTVALDAQGLVYALGRADYGTLGLGDNADVTAAPTEIPTLQDKKCVDVSCGTSVSLAVTDDGSVFSWGMGDSYQLGHGNDSDQHTPKLIEGNFSGWKALKISGGGQHTLILATSRK